MGKAILFGIEDGIRQELRKDLSEYFPHFKVSTEPGKSQPDSKDIAFLLLDEKVNLKEAVRFSGLQSRQFICLGLKKEMAYKAIKCATSDFLLYPYNPADLVNAVMKIINFQKDGKASPSDTTNIKNDIIGVPTIDGYEFIRIQDIIKCEGMQSYTRIVTHERDNIISSNNIGELRKKLAAFNFFSPHKSYLINLSSICKYSREGVIFLKHGHQVPLARRRKSEFFQLVMHV